MKRPRRRLGSALFPLGRSRLRQEGVEAEDELAVASEQVLHLLNHALRVDPIGGKRGREGEGERRGGSSRREQGGDSYEGTNELRGPRRGLPPRTWWL